MTQRQFVLWLILTLALGTGALFLLLPPASGMTVLDFTNPVLNGPRDVSVDPETGAPDTLAVCGPGSVPQAPLTDLSIVRLYWWPITGGLPRMIRIKDEQGHEGAPDTLHADESAMPGHYYLTAVDLSGNESCPSNIIYIGPITGIGDQPSGADPIVRRELFDVHGRRTSAVASGIYFERDTYASGKRIVRRRTVLK